MARTIWKFPASAQVADVGDSPRIIHFGPDPQGTPCVWIEHDPTVVRVRLEPVDRLRPFHWYIVGTGHTIPDGQRHAGSCVDGPFVWHVYQED